MTTYKDTGNSLPGKDAQGSSSFDSPVIASYLASLPADVKDLGLSIVTTSSSTLKLATPTAVVASGATAKIDVDSRAGIFTDGGASIDLSSSRRSDGSPVPVSVVATGGDNKITLNRGPSYAVSADGNDTMMSSGGHDLLRSTIGNDSLVGGGQSHIFGGSEGGDTLVGGLSSGGQDTILSQGGSHIRTSFGKSSITAGANDTIQAGLASDTINAADGATTIRGGYHTLVYGSGHSSILAGDGRNNTFNLTGDDTLVAGRGSAVVDLSDTGRASVHGGAGHLDVNTANRIGNDTLFGGSGGLTIHVSAGAGAIVNDPNKLDADGYHVLKLAGGETLHVSNVTIDFGDGRHKDV